jgi:single-strand DNA-binding protein
MLNKAMLIGFVGADPEIHTTAGGKEFVSFSLATSEKWKEKDSGERKESTEWHRVVVFNEGLAGVIKQYVKKGSKLWVEGQIKTRKWEQDGIDRYSTEILVKGRGKIEMLDTKNSGSRPPADAYDDE